MGRPKIYLNDAERRAGARERVQRWRLRNPEKWATIQEKSRHKVKALKQLEAVEARLRAGLDS